MSHVVPRPLPTAAVALTLLLSACQSTPDEPSRTAYASPPSVTEPAVGTDPTTEPDNAPAAEAAPPAPSRRAATRTQVPTELTGTWGGGSWNDSTGGRSYRFTADGAVTLGFRGTDITGTVVVEKTTMTLYFGTEELTMSWSYTDCDDPSGYGFPYKSLVLNGLSYVQDC